MFRFFRQIRQRLMRDNKFSKYLLYAIGEILLVIIGILLALQINEWDSQRSEARLLRNDLEYVLEDLNEDRITLYALIDQHKASVRICSDFLDQYMAGMEMPLNKTNDSLWDALYEKRFKRNQNGFEKVLSSKLFQSDKFIMLREKMDDYVNEIERLIYDEERLNYFIEEKELEMFTEGSFSTIYEYSRVHNGYTDKEVAIPNFDWQDLLKSGSAMKAILLRYEDDVRTFLLPQYNRTVMVGKELEKLIENYLQKK